MKKIVFTEFEKIKDREKREFINKINKFCCDHNIKSASVLQTALNIKSDNENRTYLSSLYARYKKGTSLLFKDVLEEKINDFNHKGYTPVEIDEHSFYLELNKRQKGKSYTEDEINGASGKYIILCDYNKIVIAGFEIFIENPLTYKNYPCLLFYKLIRAEKFEKTGNKEITTNGFLMKNPPGKLMGYGRTIYGGSEFLESIAISGFSGLYEVPKTALWFGISFSSEQKIVATRVLLIKVPQELEEEYQSRINETIGYYDSKELLLENELIQNILDKININIDFLIQKLNFDSNDKPISKYIKIYPY